MRRCVVLLTLVLSFVAPLALPAAQASEPGAMQARSPTTSCKRKRAKRRDSDHKKKKGKDDKKPYGFEL